MTLQEFLPIVTKLSNRVFTRHWLHFNYPETEPHLMAIAILGNHPTLEKELSGLGLHLYMIEDNEQLGQITYFTVERDFESESQKIHP